ncbi:MAG: ABC-F type ribosomal protection protein [Eubacteriales bacterium]
MLLSTSHIQKAFLEQVILSDCSFHIEDYDKVAIVGKNGAGKTTLLKILIGSLPADDGVITFAKDKTFGYLSQHDALSSGNTILEELLSVCQDLIHMEEQLRTLESNMKQEQGDALVRIMEQYTNLTHEFELRDGYAYRSKVMGILKGLSFLEDDYQKKVNTLSGGQKTRVALGKLLLQNHHLIILDEPTNHLDITSIQWLENYLINYKGAVIIVSHDRYFLDRIATKVIEIDHATVTTFTGNYSDYAKKKEHLRISQVNAYENQQKEIKHQEDVIEKLKSYNREKSIKRAESREKLLHKIDRIEKPLAYEEQMRLTLSPRTVSGNDVLMVENLSKSFGTLTLFENLSFLCKRGEHIALIGNNGTGKTTILKMINELLAPDAGTIQIGSQVYIGYYDQEHHVLHMEKTIFDEILDDYPTLTNTQIRNTLAAFLFTEDDVFKKISTLSGGERGRVSLAKLMLSEANFLILDEPTNHLDIASKEILEYAISHYEGTVFYVSHDRYFVNKTATRIIELDHNQITSYLGNYDYYLVKKEETSQIIEPSSTATSAKEDPSSKIDWKEQKQQQAVERKLQNELQKIEAEIESLELQNQDLELKMSLPEYCSNSAKLQELANTIQENTERIESLYERWEEIG